MNKVRTDNVAPSVTGDHGRAVATAPEAVGTSGPPLRDHLSAPRIAQAFGELKRPFAKVFIVLPAFNEEKALGPLLSRIYGTAELIAGEYCVVVVDDGSLDGTAVVAQEFSLQMPIHLVRHPVNQGLGCTIQDGLREAAQLSQPNDVIVSLDADNTHPPELIPRMLGLIREGHDIVIASRFRPGARTVGVPPLRSLMSFGARHLFGILFPTPGVRDFTCGFRAYRAVVLQRAFEEFGDDFVSESGFSSMVDILLKLRKQSLLIGEVPILLRYDNKGGESKMNVLNTVSRTLKLLCRRRLGRMD